MIFEQIPVGGDRNFAYLIGDTDSRKAAVVDPSFSPEKVLRVAQKKKLDIKYVIITHNHPDHTNGNTYMLSHTAASLIGYDIGTPVQDQQKLYLGNVCLQCIHTPGHTPDAMCILVEDKLITGDTLFVGKVGGTSTEAAALQEYHSLQKILSLPDHIEIYPGHDYGVSPSSTILQEKENNPFLLCDSFESFLHLKKNWIQYKKEHGIS